MGFLLFCRDDLLLGTRSFSAGCIDIRLLFSGPTHEFTALVSHSEGIPDADKCLVTAAIPIWSDDGESECDSHVWDTRGPQAKGVSYTQQLRLESSCSVGDMSLKVKLLFPAPSTNNILCVEFLEHILHFTRLLDVVSLHTAGVEESRSHHAEATCRQHQLCSKFDCIKSGLHGVPTQDMLTTEECTHVFSRADHK